MHKFIEIPIYALDKSTLRVRYEKYVDTLRREVFPDIKEETFQRCLEADMLDSIIKEQVPKKYYVDRQAFDNINSEIDYLKIINEVDNK
jgi:hypothetical protein